MLVSVGGVAVAACRSCEINVEAETIEVSSPDTGTWRTFIAGRKSWSVSCSYLVQAPGTELPQVGAAVHLSLSLRSGSSAFLEGDAIVRSCRINAEVGSIAKGSFEFVGNGELG